MDRITTVTFDLWQTLVTDPRERAEQRVALRIDGVWKALKEEGFGIPIERVQRGYAEAYQILWEIQSKEYDITIREQLENLLNLIDDGLLPRLSPQTLEKITSAYINVIFALPPYVTDGAPETLSLLKERGYKLGLICNTGATPGSAARRLLEQQGTARYLSVMTFSNEVGLCKPALGIFLETLRQLGATPEESVHVGDHPTIDVAGAKRAGMKAILLETPTEREIPVEPDARIKNLSELLEVLNSLPI
ncbi:MAG: HAD family hydrolase [Chloroflexi bacterium]|nr:HAD family hydrolase [Chloroflexota bacterium]